MFFRRKNKKHKNQAKKNQISESMKEDSNTTRSFFLDPLNYLSPFNPLNYNSTYEPSSHSDECPSGGDYISSESFDYDTSCDSDNFGSD